MKDNSTLENSKQIIEGEKISREGIYYAALFCAAIITSVILLIVSIRKFNRGLTIYASVLIPLFTVACLLAVRYILACKDKIHIKDGNLVIKTFFITRKFKTTEIKRINATHNEKLGVAFVKIFYGEKTYSYKFKLTKEQTVQLKRSVRAN